jgi:hypothetical protein
MVKREIDTPKVVVIEIRQEPRRRPYVVHVRYLVVAHLVATHVCFPKYCRRKSLSEASSSCFINSAFETGHDTTFDPVLGPLPRMVIVHVPCIAKES